MKTAFNRRTVILAAALGAGTTLLQACGGGDDEPQRNIVELAKNTPELSILVEAVVAACAPHGVPVTLKMRTGWCQSHKNAVVLARAAEQAGVQMITVHGRTREQGYKGHAEYDTIAAVKAAVRVPVVANGDIDTPEKARQVLAATSADAVMIGRAAQGRPWIFREINHFLATGTHLAPPLVAEVKHLLLDHLQDHYSLYGEFSGVRTARKHIGWYVKALPGAEDFRARMNLIEDCRQQIAAVADFWDGLNAHMDRMPVRAEPGLVGEEKQQTETAA